MCIHTERESETGNVMRAPWHDHFSDRPAFQIQDFVVAWVPAPSSVCVLHIPSSLSSARCWLLSCRRRCAVCEFNHGSTCLRTWWILVSPTAPWLGPLAPPTKSWARSIRAWLHQLDMPLPFGEPSSLGKASLLWHRCFPLSAPAQWLTLSHLGGYMPAAARLHGRFSLLRTWFPDPWCACWESFSVWSWPFCAQTSCPRSPWRSTSCWGHLFHCTVDGSSPRVSWISTSLQTKTTCHRKRHCWC